MSTWIALIRGINVGGHKKVSMPDLKKVCESLGYTDVRTWLNSGNVLFTAKTCDAAQLEKAIAEATGTEARVVLRSPKELAEAIERNPLKGEPNRVMIVFLDRKPKGELGWDGPEETHLDGRHLYIHYTESMADSKLTNTVIERRLGVVSTARNLNTANKLLELSHQQSHPKG